MNILCPQRFYRTLLESRNLLLKLKLNCVSKDFVIFFLENTRN